MKRTDKKTDTKKIASICGLSALSLAVLAGAYFLTREPEAEFIPSSVQTDTATDTWKLPEDKTALGKPQRCPLLERHPGGGNRRRPDAGAHQRR